MSKVWIIMLRELF